MHNKTIMVLGWSEERMARGLQALGLSRRAARCMVALRTGPGPMTEDEIAWYADIPQSSVSLGLREIDAVALDAPATAACGRPPKKWILPDYDDIVKKMYRDRSLALERSRDEALDHEI